MTFLVVLFDPDLYSMQENFKYNTTYLPLHTYHNNSFKRKFVILSLTFLKTSARFQSRETQI